jgi:Outer membrane protein beta-barrel domain
MTKSVDIARVVAGGAAAAAGFAEASQAQDVTGFYAGLGLGMPNGSFSIGRSDDYSHGGTSSSLFAGYNHAMGDWVIGAEVGFNSGLEIEPLNGNTYDASVGKSVTLKARAGRVFGNRLVYASLGFASADMSVFGFDYGMDGMVYGAGVETGIGANGFIGLDVTADDFKNGDYTTYVDDISLTATSIRAGFRF